MPACVLPVSALEGLGSGGWRAGAVLRFAGVSIGGLGIGLLVGWLASHVQRRMDDPPIQVTVSLLTPFAAYIPAERVHASGVLAVVAAGLFLGWRSPRLITARTRLN